METDTQNTTNKETKVEDLKEENTTESGMKSLLQAGGHPNQVLIHAENPHQIIKKTSLSEALFYSSLVHQIHHLSSQLHHHLPCWDGWRPHFFGCLDPLPDLPAFDHKKEAIIILENLTFGRPVRRKKKQEGEGKEEEEETIKCYSRPNIIDIKLGERLYDEEATAEKKERMKKVAHETTSHLFGIRLTGAQLWNNELNHYLTIPKSFGKSVDPKGTDLPIKFNSFFPISDEIHNNTNNNNQEEKENLEKKSKKKQVLSYSKGSIPPKIMKEIIDKSIIPKINKILNYIKKLNWRIYGSSLLIIFESNLIELNSIFNSLSEEEEEEGEKEDREERDKLIEELSTVKLIDFAHVQVADSPDLGLLNGIQSLLDLFLKLSRDLA